MEDIIWCVKQHPHLYDQIHASSTVLKQREESWKEIGIDLELSAEFVKRKWNSLRRAYVKYLKLDPKYKDFKWSEHMDFIRPYLDLNAEEHEEYSSAEGGQLAKHDDKIILPGKAFGFGEAVTTTTAKKKKTKKLSDREVVAKQQQFEENIVSLNGSKLEEKHISLKEPQLEVSGSVSMLEEIPDTNIDKAKSTLSSPKKTPKAKTTLPRKKTSSVIPMENEKPSVLPIKEETDKKNEIKLEQNGHVKQMAEAASGINNASSEAQVFPEKKAEVKKAAPRKRRQTLKQSEIESLKSAAVLNVDNDADISQNKNNYMAAVSTPIADDKPAAFHVKLLTKKGPPRKKKLIENKVVTEASKNSTTDVEKSLQLNGDASSTATVSKATPRKRRPTVKETDIHEMVNNSVAQKLIQPNGDTTPAVAKKTVPPKRRPTLKDTQLPQINFETSEKGEQNFPNPTKLDPKNAPPLKKRRTKAEIQQSKDMARGIVEASFQSLENTGLTMAPSEIKPMQQTLTSSITKCFQPRLSMESSSSSQIDVNTTLNSSLCNQTLDGTELLFLGFAKTLKNFAPKRQSLTKLEIAKIIMEQEMHEFDDEHRDTTASEH